MYFIERSSVVGDAFDGADAVKKTVKLHPDVVIMDLVMPRMDGVAAIEEIRNKAPEAKILLLTTFSSSENIVRAIKAGASGVALKSASNGELLKAIFSVGEGKTVITPDIQQLLANDPPLPELSMRQLEILDSIARGLTNREISSQLDISLESVKSHVKIILEKLGAASRAEAASIALRKHLLKI